MFLVFAITALFPLMLTFASIFMPEEKVKTVDCCEEHLEELETLKQTSVEAKESKENFGWQTLKKVFQFIMIPEVFQPILIIFIFQITPSSGASMFYFYTNELGFEPEFMGKLTVVYSLASIGGIFFYNKYLKNVAFKKIFVVSVVIGSSLGLL